VRAMLATTGPHPILDVIEPGGHDEVRPPVDQ
jgi:hypothetical protein